MRTQRRERAAVAPPRAAREAGATLRPLWKVREGFSIPVYETGACDVQAQVQYNLADGRYLFDMTSIGAGKNDIRWLTEDNGSPRLKRDFFTSDNLRAISER
ncbi:DUF1329 domain-containing protein [Pseudomonas aeruginosa]|nr:DUF1329 domain-containing protein [Pseudomonas aeruginosa]